MALLKPRPKGLNHIKTKWWAIYTNLPVNATVKLPHLWSGNSQNQETFLASPVDNQTRKHDTDCSNHHPFLSTTRLKTLCRGNMKWWPIYTNLPINAIVRLPHPQSGNTQCQKTFVAPTADNQTWNHDADCSIHHPSLSTPRPKGSCRWKMKWWAIYTNFPMNAITRLPHPRSRDRQGQETVSEASADNKTCNYDTECSNHHPSLSRPMPKGLNCSKMKWWAIYSNLRVNAIVKLPHHCSGDSEGQETFFRPSADNQTSNHDTECSDHHPSLSTPRPKALCRRKMKCELYTQICQKMP